MEANARRSRRAESRAELDRFGAEVDRWFLDLKADKEITRLHGRQLKVLTSTITTAAKLLRGHLDAIPASQATPAFFRACRAQDVRVIWLRALWSYFRTKFDQRRDPLLRPLLAAADEVVWACYSTAYENLNQLTPPPPLPYVDALFSPRAIPMDEPPTELKNVDAAFLQEFLKRLPIGVVALPPTCLTSPWWLAHVAHEVGHHVQHEFGFVDQFQLAMTHAASSIAWPRDGMSGTWSLWGEELFADASALCLIGGSATRALAEFELSGTTMDSVKPKYPASAIRLEWQQHVLDELKLPRKEALGAAMASQLSTVKEAQTLSENTTFLLNEVSVLAKAVLATRFKTGGQEARIADVFGVDAGAFSANGKVEELAEDLLDGVELNEAKNVFTIRLLVSAGVVGWASTLEAADHVEKQSVLAGALLKNLRAHSPPGEHAVEEAVKSEDIGDFLAETLMAEDPAKVSAAL